MAVVLVLVLAPRAPMRAVLLAVVLLLMVKAPSGSASVGR